MSDPSNEDATKFPTFDEALKEREKGFYILRLYVSGNTARSSRAIQNIQRVCKQRLAGRYQLEVIDIFQQPHLAREAQIIAVPTLIRQLPLHLRKLVVDMAVEKRLLIGLDILDKND
jgi:circadian clock protein KaiB